MVCGHLRIPGCQSAPVRTTNLGSSNPQAKAGLQHLTSLLSCFSSKHKPRFIESNDLPLRGPSLLLEYIVSCGSDARFLSGPLGQCVILQDGVMHWRSARCYLWTPVRRDRRMDDDNLPPHSEWKTSSAHHVMDHQPHAFCVNYLFVVLFSSSFMTCVV